MRKSPHVVMRNVKKAEHSAQRRAYEASLKSEFGDGQKLVLFLSAVHEKGI